MRKLCMLAICVLCTSHAFAGEQTADQKLEDLRTRLEKVEAQLREKVAGKDGNVMNWLDSLKESAVARGLDFSLVVETEASYTDQEGENVSDFILATMELSLSATVSENVSTEVVLLWEEDDNEQLFVDSAVVELHNLLGRPLKLTVGKMYVPFGQFECRGICMYKMITNPLTLDLSETRESAVLLTYERTLASISVGAFNGDVGADRLDNFVARLDCTPSRFLGLGAQVISDIRESETLQEIVDTTVEDDQIWGVGAYVSLFIRDITVHAEYVEASQTMAAGVIDAEPRRPSAWTVEAAVPLAPDWEMSTRYERSREMPTFAETRYGAKIGHALMEHVGLAVEYLRSDFPGSSDSDTVTAQLAFEF